MAFRWKYWSCSKFSDWVRGTEKPSSGTSSEWNVWNKAAKAAHPTRYWLAEEGLGKLQDFVNWPMDQLQSATYWFNNRFIEKTHICDTHLKPGDWHETDKRIMYGIFGELRNFVEQQKSWMYFCTTKDDCKDIPFYKHTWPFRHFTKFCYPELGLKYLDWEISLTVDEEHCGYEKGTMPEEEKAKCPEFGQLTHQAIAAMEIKEIYNWWMNVRPNRPDPHEAGGWSAYCDAMRGDDDDEFSFLRDDRTDEEREMGRIALDAVQKIEDAYEAEDLDMMIRVLKRRGNLWV